MDERRQRATRRLVLLLDAATLVVAGVGAFALHDVLAASVEVVKARPPSSQYAVVVYAAVPVWLALVSWLGLDRVSERRWSPLQLTRDLLVLHALGFVALASLLFLSQGVLNRTLVGLFFALQFALSFAGRWALTRWFQRQYRRGLFRPTWVLVGEAGDAMRHFAKALEDEAFPPHLGGVLTSSAGPLDGLPCAHLGAPAQLATVLHEHAVDLVVFFPPLHQPSLAADAVHACEKVGVPTSFVVDHGQRYAYRPSLRMVGATPLLSFDWTRPRDAQLALKHLFDPLAAALLLVLVSPVLLVTSLAVLVTMGRPIFFGQERVGHHGRRFRMWKFRSMVHGAEARRDALLAQNEMSGPVFKVTDDPRVTPVGRVIRKWSIDELPQFVNVLLGEMSLVGPRPLPLGEQQDIEGWYRRRLSMRPGITGLWQVSGRSGIDFDAWMQLDLKYVDEWSLLLDLKLLALTLPAVVARRGAK
jgi:exopolysaccharide biosynthesis polyprenyl glycosylphosphotransferase